MIYLNIKQIEKLVERFCENEQEKEKFIDIFCLYFGKRILDNEIEFTETDYCNGIEYLRKQEAIK